MFQRVPNAQTDPGELLVEVVVTEVVLLLPALAIAMQSPEAFDCWLRRPESHLFIQLEVEWITGGGVDEWIHMYTLALTWKHRFSRALRSITLASTGPASGASVVRFLSAAIRYYTPLWVLEAMAFFWMASLCLTQRHGGATKHPGHLTAHQPVQVCGQKQYYSASHKHTCQVLALCRFESSSLDHLMTMMPIQQ